MIRPAALIGNRGALMLKGQAMLAAARKEEPFPSPRWMYMNWYMFGICERVMLSPPTEAASAGYWDGVDAREPNPDAAIR